MLKYFGFRQRFSFLMQGFRHPITGSKSKMKRNKGKHLFLKGTEIPEKNAIVFIDTEVSTESKKILENIRKIWNGLEEWGIFR